MISDKVARDGLAALSVAAVILIEDEVERLTIAQTDVMAGRGLATSLIALGSDISVLGAAALVLVRNRDGNDGPLSAT